MATAAYSMRASVLPTATNVIAVNDLTLPAQPACCDSVSRSAKLAVVSGPTRQNAGRLASRGASHQNGLSRRATAVSQRQYASSLLLDQEVPESDVSPQLSARLCKFIRSASSVDEALQILAKMREADISPTADAYAAVISVCRRYRDADRALDTYNTMREQGVVPDTATLNELLISLGQCQKLSAALRLKDEMASHGIEPDVVTYTSVMAILSYSRSLNDQECLRRISGLFEEMVQAGIAPDTFCFNTVIRAAARARQMDQALAYYEAMKAGGRHPVDPTPNKGRRAAASKSINQGQATSSVLSDHAETTLPGSSPANSSTAGPVVAPNQYTYDILIDGACASHRVPVATELFREMRARRVRPGPSAYNRMVTAHLQGPGATSRLDLEAAFAFFDDMIADKVSPRGSTVDALVAEFPAVEPPLPLVVVAARLDALFTAADTYDLALAPVTYERLIQWYVKGDHNAGEATDGGGLVSTSFMESSSDMQQGGEGQTGASPASKHFAVYRAMRRANVAATPAAVALLAEACARDGDAKGAVELLAGLERPGAVATSKPRSPLKPDGSDVKVAANGKTGPRVSRALGSAGQASGVQPGGVSVGKGGVGQHKAASKAVYHALMAAFGRAGQWESAIAACDKMRSDPSLTPLERAPDASTYEVLFSACMGENGLASAMSPMGRDGRSLLTSPALAAAVELYREAVSAHVLPSPATLDMGPHVVDLRGLSRTASVVAMVTALEACAAAPPSPLAGDFKFVLSIAGSGRANPAPEDVAVTASVLESVAANGLGLPMRRELAGNMAAVAVDSAQLGEWLLAPPFVVAERVYSSRA